MQKWAQLGTALTCCGAHVSGLHRLLGMEEQADGRDHCWPQVWCETYCLTTEDRPFLPLSGHSPPVLSYMFIPVPTSSNSGCKHTHVHFLPSQWAIAFTRALHAHLQEDADIRYNLREVLSEEELDELMASKHRPVKALTVLAEIIKQVGLTRG